MFSKVGVKVFLGYYEIKTFFWIFCFAKILCTKKKAQIWANFHKARTKYFKIIFFASQIA